MDIDGCTLLSRKNDLVTLCIGEVTRVRRVNTVWVSLTVSGEAQRREGLGMNVDVQGDAGELRAFFQTERLTSNVARRAVAPSP